MGELAEVFRQGWTGWAGSKETPCGSGSSLRHSLLAREELPRILKITGPRVNEAGCGDLHWLGDARPPDYAGYDVVEWDTWPALRAEGVHLEVGDVREPGLMRACDLVICRDVMIHLPARDVLEVLESCRETAGWLLATTYDRADTRPPLRKASRNYRRLDLGEERWGLGEMVEWVPDGGTLGKGMGLWHLAGG